MKKYSWVIQMINFRLYCRQFKHIFFHFNNIDGYFVDVSIFLNHVDMWVLWFTAFCHNFCSIQCLFEGWKFHNGTLIEDDGFDQKKKEKKLQAAKVEGMFWPLPRGEWEEPCLVKRKQRQCIWRRVFMLRDFLPFYGPNSSCHCPKVQQKKTVNRMKLYTLALRGRNY